MLTRSLSIAGIVEPVAGTGPERASPRALIEWTAGLGYRAVQVDGALRGLRARELDRSGRRDLAALLKRLGLGLSGVDFWVPVGDFVEGPRIERAVGATLETLGLAAELARLVHGGLGVVSVSLPEGVSADVVACIAGEAERVGARLADHSWPPIDRIMEAVGVGIDPVAVMGTAADVGAAVSRLAIVPLAARLSDVRDGVRVAVGAGRLDVLAYEIALETKGYAGQLVVDVRGVRGQADAAREAAKT